MAGPIRDPEIYMSAMISSFGYRPTEHLEDPDIKISAQFHNILDVLGYFPDVSTMTGIFRTAIYASSLALSACRLKQPL